MRPFEGTIVVEGERDHDGREIREGALSWRTPLPIFDVARSRVLGHANVVERDGREVRVVGAVDLPVGEYGVGAGVIVAAAEGEVVTAGRLRDAAVTSNPSFEAARIRVLRDHIEDKVTATIRAGTAEAYTLRSPDDDEEDE